MLFHINNELRKRKIKNKESFETEFELEKKKKKIKKITNKIRKINLPSNPYLVKYSDKKFIKKLVKKGEVFLIMLKIMKIASILLQFKLKNMKILNIQEKKEIFHLIKYLLKQNK